VDRIRYGIDRPHFQGLYSHRTSSGDFPAAQTRSRDATLLEGRSNDDYLEYVWHHPAAVIGPVHTSSERPHSDSRNYPHLRPFSKSGNPSVVETNSASRHGVVHHHHHPKNQSRKRGTTPASGHPLPRFLCYSLHLMFSSHASLHYRRKSRIFTEPFNATHASTPTFQNLAHQTWDLLHEATEKREISKRLQVSAFYFRGFIFHF
jgi:hypothetical protein